MYFRKTIILVGLETPEGMYYERSPGTGGYKSVQEARQVADFFNRENPPESGMWKVYLLTAEEVNPK